jgi:hypothetical protein
VKENPELDYDGLLDQVTSLSYKRTRTNNFNQSEQPFNYYQVHDQGSQLPEMKMLLPNYPKPNFASIDKRKKPINVRY